MRVFNFNTAAYSLSLKRRRNPPNSGSTELKVVLVTKLTDANLSYSFEIESTYKTTNHGVEISEANCNFKASVSGYIKVLSMPHMKLIETIPFEGIQSQDIDTLDSECPITDTQKANMFSSAITDALSSNSTNFKLHSAVAARAFIVDKKVDEKRTYFKTTLKRSLGAKEGEGVRLYMEDEDSNELLFVADGVIIKDYTASETTEDGEGHHEHGDHDHDHDHDHEGEHNH